MGSVVDDRYRIDERIGVGGMADVWLASDLELPRQVALKILHERFVADPQFTERFRREAEAAARLQHVNIVPIFDRGRVGDTYYIAMAYIDGRTLRDLIRIGLTPAESISIVRQILEAAGFAHRHGVIHRDLKPLNVLVDDSGLVTVTDFGIARAGVGGITDEGSVLGTIRYLSPEQAQGQDVTPLSDLYSIGIVLYECLTGRVPFDGDSAVEIAMKQMREEPLPPSAWNPAVSPALDAVVLKSLSREPYNRFPDADSFIDALDRVEDEPPAPEAGGSRWKWFAIAAAGVLLFLIIWGLLRSNTVAVPDVTGENLDAAVTTLTNEDFKVGTIQRVKRQGPANRVLKQDPRDEASRDCALFGWFCSNPPVDLVVSGGPGRVKVPDVTGLNRSEAQAQLDQAGFGVEAESRSSDSVPKDTVIETDPPAGESVARGSTVTMLVSSGVEQVKVPAVVGMPLDAARQQLSAVGLELETSKEPGDRPKDEVLEQSPSAGTRVEPGSSVSLVISSGPQKQTVPNVVGSTRSEAESTLGAAGFTVTVQEQPTTIQPQDGRVIDQSPAGNSEADPGSRVTITVGSYSGGSDGGGGGSGGGGSGGGGSGSGGIGPG
ncbi:MAG: PASTA domain-containing protein [Solirubrobacterales bacterium]|nr:PASTA domain-containing protein [Solirubrobacterales bacterium]